MPRPCGRGTVAWRSILVPGAYMERQVRVTPFPIEPTGWIIENSSPNICMFSSDYPHLEGGRKPLGRFDKEFDNVPADVQDRFFRSNFEDLMGSSLRALASA